MKRKSLISILIITALIIFSASAVYAQEEVEPTRIALTWQNDTQTTMSITWRTKGEADSMVYYTEAENKNEDSFKSQNANTWTFEGTKYWVHGTELKDLEPDTEYVVYLKTGDEKSDEFKFETAPSFSEKITFLAGADSRTNIEDRREIMKKAAEIDPDFVLFTGDYINGPLSDSDWERWFEDWSKHMITEDNKRIPIIPAIGNHEVRGSTFGSRKDARFYYNNFLLPGNEKYYTLEYGPDLTLLTLDSNHTSNVYGGEQLEWLQKTLPEIDNDWIVAQYHIPAWSSYKSFNRETSINIRDHWLPLFEEYGVDLVNEADDHSYKVAERMFGLKEFKKDLDEMIYDGMERAEKDFDPEKDYTPWNMPNLSALSGGDWEEVEGVDSIREGLAELAYYSSIYLKSENDEIDYDLVYEEMAKSTLYKDFWEQFPDHYDIFNEEGILYIGDGGWGAPLRGVAAPEERWYLKDTAAQYNFFEVNLYPSENRMEVTPHIWQDQEEWIKLDSFVIEEK